MAYYDFLNVIFAPLLNLPVLWAIIILSLIVSLIVIIVTKLATDQKLMKQLKDELKGHQKKIKEHRNNPSEAMKLQKQAMETNMKYMMHSFRATFITIIPILFIFGWMNATFTYPGIMPEQEFTVTATFESDGEAEILVAEGLRILDTPAQDTLDGKAKWTLSGDLGEQIFDIEFNGEKQQHSVLISDDGKYSQPLKKTKGQIKTINVDMEKNKILNLFGWKLGWLGTYIIFSIIFTMVLRKVMKVY